MKRRLASTGLLLLSLGLAPSAGFAQPPQGVDPELLKRLQDPEAMQRMAAEAEAAQKCLEGIERKKLEALRTRGEAASAEVERLCAEGKKQEALARALALSREMRGDPTVKKLRECTKGMSAMMQRMPLSQLPGVQDRPDPTDDDICS